MSHFICGREAQRSAALALLPSLVGETSPPWAMFPVVGSSPGLLLLSSEHVSSACSPASRGHFAHHTPLPVHTAPGLVLSHLTPCLLRLGRWLKEERKATCFLASSDKHVLSRADRCLKVRYRASIHLLGSAAVYKAFAGSGLMLFDIVRPPSVSYCLVTNLTASIVLHLLIPYVLSSN